MIVARKNTIVNGDNYLTKYTHEEYNIQGGIMQKRQAKIDRVVKSLLRSEKAMLELIESDFKGEWEDIDDMLLNMIGEGSKLLQRLTKNTTNISKSRYISPKMQDTESNTYNASGDLEGSSNIVDEMTESKENKDSFAINQEMIENREYQSGQVPPNTTRPNIQ